MVITCIQDLKFLFIKFKDFCLQFGMIIWQVNRLSRGHSQGGARLQGLCSILVD